MRPTGGILDLFVWLQPRIYSAEREGRDGDGDGNEIWIVVE
jgi:hypothetical protein